MNKITIDKGPCIRFTIFFFTICVKLTHLGRLNAAPVQTSFVARSAALRAKRR